MPHVVFAVPFALSTTLRFVRAMGSVPGVRLSLLSQEPLERMPADLRELCADYERVGDAMDAGQLAAGVRALAARAGGQVDQLVGILEPLQEKLAAVRAALGIPGMTPEVAHNFRDKARMKELLRANDLPCARHGLAHSPAQALAFGEECGYPMVVKPPAGAGAKNTFRVNSREELEQSMRSLTPREDDPLLLEEFIVGAEHSFDSVTINGQHLFHSITRYFPTPLEVMENPWLQWAVVLPRSIDGPEYDAIKNAGPRSLDALGLQTALTHMEWFQREDGSVAISEVAARPPGAQFTSLLSWAYERDFYADWARLVATGEFEAPERRWAVGCVFLRGQGEGSVKQVHGVDEAKLELGELLVEAKLPQVGQPRASSYEGEGHIVLRHSETEAVMQGIRRLFELLRIEIA